MTSVAELELRYLHRTLSSSLGTQTLYTAGSGSTTTVAAAALTQADDYWNGALLVWTGGPNAGRWSIVRDFDATTDTLTLGDPLPVAAASGHNFRLYQGGKHASQRRVLGLAAPALVNVTGLTLLHVAHLNGEGTGILRYDAADGSLTWQPPRAEPGAAVSATVLGLGDQVTLFGAGETDEELSRFIRLSRNASALPAEDAEDALSLDLVRESFLGSVSADEAVAGVTTYWPVAVYNAGSMTVRDVLAYCEEAFPGAATTTLTAALGTGAGTLEAASLEAWGASGWVLNVTKGDARYFCERTGNAAAILDPDGGVRGFTAVAWDVGDELAPLPWIDIGLDAPGSGSVFEDPASRTTAPSGVSFSCPRAEDEALEIGDLAAGGLHAIWIRLEVPSGARPVEGGRTEVRLVADFTE